MKSFATAIVPKKLANCEAPTKSGYIEADTSFTVSPASGFFQAIYVNDNCNLGPAREPVCSMVWAPMETPFQTIAVVRSPAPSAETRGSKDRTVSAFHYGEP